MALKEQVFGSYATICPTTLVEYESYAYKIIYYHTLYSRSTCLNLERKRRLIAITTVARVLRILVRSYIMLPIE